MVLRRGRTSRTSPRADPCPDASPAAGPRSSGAFVGSAATTASSGQVAPPSRENRSIAFGRPRPGSSYGLPVLERLGQHPAGKPQERSRRRRGRMGTEVDGPRRAPGRPAVARGRVVVAHRQQALRLLVDPRLRGVRPIRPEHGRRQLAGRELRQLESSGSRRARRRGIDRRGRDGATPTSRRDPARPSRPCAHRPTRARFPAGTSRRASRRTRGTPRWTTPIVHWRARWRVSKTVPEATRRNVSSTDPGEGQGQCTDAGPANPARRDRRPCPRPSRRRRLPPPILGRIHHVRGGSSACLSQ